MNEKPKVNIYELAKETGYSTSTVSKVINNTGRIGESTRKKILEKASEMNYVPSYHAKVLSDKKSWIIAVIFSDNLASGFSHPYFSVILEHFKRRVESEGYEVTFINRNMGKNEMTYLDFCRYRKVEGVYMVNSYGLSKQIPQLIESGIPIVTSDAGNLNIPTITSDDKLGGRLATKHLIDLGHTNIVHISGPLYTISGQKRFDGFKEMMSENSLDNSKVVEANNYGFEDGYNSAMDIINSGELPTAVFAGGDWLALGAMKAFHQHSIRVPEDISIIGYDDLDFVKYTNPALTTISQKKDEIGYACADFLLETISGKEAVARKLNVELVVRETCKKIN